MQISDIEKKLGFNPLLYKPDIPHFENDNYESPLSVLSLDELRFLLDYYRKMQNK